jgi:hypothetical protein
MTRGNQKQEGSQAGQGNVTHFPLLMMRGNESGFFAGCAEIFQK